MYHAELQESFSKVSSHLDVLNHLGGGEYLKTYDQDLVDGLLKISLFFIQVELLHCDCHSLVGDLTFLSILSQFLEYPYCPRDRVES